MTISYTKSFRRDCKVLRKRRWDLKKQERYLDKLTKEDVGHDLKGKLTGKSECHINFDWVLVYEVVGDVIKLLRTGTHAEALGI